MQKIQIPQECLKIQKRIQPQIQQIKHFCLRKKERNTALQQRCFYLLQKREKYKKNTKSKKRGIQQRYFYLLQGLLVQLRLDAKCQEETIPERKKEKTFSLILKENIRKQQNQQNQQNKQQHQQKISGKYISDDVFVINKKNTLERNSK